MKIKGIHSGRHGKRGTPILLNQNEKAVEAVKEAMRNQGDDKISFLVHGVEVDDVNKRASREVQARGQKREPVTYDAHGLVKFKKYNPTNDSLTPMKTVKFKIRFQDHRDDLGQPDLKVVDFTTK